MLRRTFDGAISETATLDLLGSRCDVRSIETHPESRSLFVSPNHTFLSTLAGGHERVVVQVDRKLAYSGPKLMAAGGFFPQGCIVESQWPATSLTYFALSVPHACLEELAGRSLPGEHWRPWANLDDTFLQASLRELGTWVRARPASGELLFGECLLSTVQLTLLQRLAATKQKPRPERVVMRAALEYIEAHLSESISLVDLCAAANVSRSQISRAFRTETGMPPHRFIMHRRMLRSKQMLAESDLPIATIATLVGCANGAHLTRMFQRFFGVTPRTWRFKARM